MSLSVSVDIDDDAVTVRPSAETIPVVTVGVPSARPSAFPIATTASPTLSFFEFPKETAGSPEMLLIRINATSLIGLVPMSVAGSFFVDPERVTVIDPPNVAAAIT